MQDVFVGLLAVLVGGLLCFFGYVALRIVIALWGAFAGFFLGAGMVAGVTGEGFLGSLLAWTVGIIGALILGLVAFAFYVVSVVLGMGAIGFTLGTTLMAALGVTWSWVVVLVGLAVGVLLAILAVVGDMPLIILAVLGSFAGASVVLAGVMLMFDIIGRDELAAPETTATVELGWGWIVSYLVLAIAGIVVQLRSADARRGTLRAAWGQ